MNSLWSNPLCILAVAAMATPLPALATTYVCQNISGMAYYPDDRQPGWGPDTVSGGQFVIRIGGENYGDVTVTRNGQSKSLTAEGGFVIPTGKIDKHGFDGLQIWYTNDGIIEHYAVFSEGSQYRLAWTTFRVRVTANQPTKIASYTADCDKS